MATLADLRAANARAADAEVAASLLLAFCASGNDADDGVLGGCIACRSQSCGGPLDFIDGMIWR